ncbi:two-component system, OmpR family, phosphate regulon sensor histidine kinase PhoR [Moraxella cuniculi DSM 21768]|uniref:histidine kinase n=1 Tax=Moraxella cuniculi DSM 21768 TaxID=1122245 RepID=A0A1N7FRW3_9GAMM|nr:phosphate regulon sensor histidine kinase PhoR [Moraxella cuniculi]SIS03014.1 two-component system, OmpR family, phosphate regulon sensor histidine kinase PhoR [Moraxella cuniculi DSM 21768]
MNQAIDECKLLHQLADGVVVVAYEAGSVRVVFSNTAAKTLLGMSNPSSDDTSNLVQLFDDEIGQYLLDRLTHGDKDGAADACFYQKNAHTDGVLQLSITAVPNRPQLLVVIKDYTRTWQLEQMRTDFVGNVSHELRTPLTVILGYLENFGMMDDLSPALARGTKLMHEQAIRMNALINDLLMLSRLESDETKPMVAVNMPRLLMQIFDEAQATNKAGHLIDLHLDTDKNILGIESYLYSAIINLVVNAIKYTPAGGEIDISYEEIADGVQLSVTDNGIGIADEHLKRLTERFYRVDSGRSRATGGTGLGLAIVKHILAKHHAKLHISSQQGRGSTFRMIFPTTQLADGLME